MLPKTASRIPKFNELRHKINYGEDRKPLSLTFWKHLQVFRELYSSPSGVPGCNFLKWKDHSHVIELYRMVDSFLDGNGNGQKYWPDSSDALEYNSLQYSRDHEFIKATLVQILFRLNRQQYSNTQYKRKSKDKPFGSSSQKSRQHQIYQNPSSPTIQPKTPDESTPPNSYAYTSASFVPNGIVSSHAEDGITNRGSGNSQEDPYMIPESPASLPEDGNPILDHHHTAAETSVNNGPSPQIARKAEPQSSTSLTAKKSGGRKRPRTEDAPIYRNPPRLRRQAQRLPGMASEEDLDEACMSPRSSIAPSDNGAAGQSTEAPEPGTATVDSMIRDSAHPKSNTQPPEPGLLEQDDTRRASFPGSAGHGSEIWPPTPSQFEFSSYSSTAIAPEVRETLAELASWRPAGIPTDASGTDTAFTHNPHPPEAEEDASLESDRIQMDPTTQRAPVAMMEPTSQAIDRSLPEAPTGVSTFNAAANEPELPSSPLEASPQKTSTSEPELAGSTDQAYEGPSNSRTSGPGESTRNSAKHVDTNISKDVPAKEVKETVNLKVSFCVVHSRSPRWRAEEWFPKGKFLKKTLPVLKEELPAGFASNAPGLMFRLIGPNLRREEPVPHDEASTFSSMTAEFGSQIRKAMRAQDDGKFVSLRIEIEALSENYLVEGKDREDDADDEDLC